MDTSAFISLCAVCELCFVLGSTESAMQELRRECKQKGEGCSPSLFPSRGRCFLALQQRREKQTTLVVPTWKCDSDVLIF